MATGDSPATLTWAILIALGFLAFPCARMVVSRILILTHRQTVIRHANMAMRAAQFLVRVRDRMTQGRQGLELRQPLQERAIRGAFMEGMLYR